jgi:hypothetical protein
MKRFTLVFALMLAFASNSFAQIKIEGEKQATVGYMLKLKLSQLAVDDPQIKCFPENPDWIATKDFAGQAWIIYVPGKKALAPGQKSALYTFVIAGNKGGKTSLETWEVTVRPDEDVPIPVPDDSILQTKLYKNLLAAYKVSPDATSKSSLLLIYESFLEDVKADKFKSFKEAGDALAATTKKYPTLGLQSVRDVVADYFVTKVGTSGWNKDKLTTAVNDVLTTLKKVPD